MAPKLPVAKTGPFPRNTGADRAVTVTSAGSGGDAEAKANTDCTDRNTHHKYPPWSQPRAVTELHLRTLQTPGLLRLPVLTWSRVLRPPACSAGRTEQPVPGNGNLLLLLQVCHTAQPMACAATVLLLWMFSFYFSALN